MTRYSEIGAPALSLASRRFNAAATLRDVDALVCFALCHGGATLADVTMECAPMFATMRERSNRGDFSAPVVERAERGRYLFDAERGIISPETRAAYEDAAIDHGIHRSDVSNAHMLRALRHGIFPPDVDAAVAEGRISLGYGGGIEIDGGQDAAPSDGPSDPWKSESC